MLTKIGFVGVGRMGAGMALSAKKAGFDTLFVRHQTAKLPDKLLDSGCIEIDNIPKLISTSDLLVLCLPSSQEVGEVLNHMGNDIKPSSGIVLDCTTSLPTETVKWAEVLQRFGIHLYDAPLTRGPIEAEAGRLRCITSCSGDDWLKAEPVVMSFSEDVVHVEKVGKAHELKLVNNLLSMGQICLAVDALTVAQAYSVSSMSLQQVVSGGAASSPALTALLQYLDGDNRVLNFKIESALKDVKYAVSSAALEGRPLTIARAIEETFSRAVEQGFGTEPLPSLLKVAGVVDGPHR